MAIRLYRDSSIKVKLHSILGLVPEYQLKDYQVADTKDSFYIWSDSFKKVLKTIKAMGFEVVESPVQMETRKYENIFPAFEKQDVFLSKRAIVRIHEKDISSIAQYLFESNHDAFHMMKSKNNFYILIENIPLFWTHGILFFDKFTVFTERKPSIFVKSNEEYVFTEILVKEESGYYVIENGNNLFLSADSFKYSYDIIDFKFDLNKVRSETKSFEKVQVNLSLKLMEDYKDMASLWRLTEHDIDRLPELIDNLSSPERDLLSIGAYDFGDELVYFAKISNKAFGKPVYAKVMNFFNGESYYSPNDGLRVFVTVGYRIFPDIETRTLSELVKSSENYLSIFVGGDNHHSIISLKENSFVPLSSSYTVTSLRFSNVIESVYNSIHFSIDPIAEKVSKTSMTFEGTSKAKKEIDTKETINKTTMVVNPHFETVSKGGVRGSIWSKIHETYVHPAVYGRACLYSGNVKNHNPNFISFINFLNSEDVYENDRVKGMLSKMQKNITIMPKHFYWFFMKELANKTSDALLLQQQREFLFSHLNKNSLDEVDFPPFVTASYSEDEIEKDSFNGIMDLIVNNKLIPNKEIRYLLYKFAEVALLQNNETPSFTIPAVEMNEDIHKSCLRKINDRISLIKSGKQSDADWIEFLDNARKNRDSFYIESSSKDELISKIKYIQDIDIASSEPHSKFLRDILSGGNPDTILKNFAAKKLSATVQAQFFIPIVEKIRQVNSTAFYDAMHTYFPFKQSMMDLDAKNTFHHVCVYICLYAMNGEAQKLEEMKKNLVRIFNSDAENPNYGAYSTVASICGADFVSEFLSQKDDSNSNSVIKVYKDMAILAMLYGSGRTTELYQYMLKFLVSTESNLRNSVIRGALYTKNVFGNLFNYASSLSMSERRHLIEKCLEITLIPNITQLDANKANLRQAHISMVAMMMYSVMNAGSLRDRIMKTFLRREEAVLRQEMIATKIQ